MKFTTALCVRSKPLGPTSYLQPRYGFETFCKSWPPLPPVVPDVLPEWAQAKPGFNDQLLNDRRNRFFSAYMIKAKQKMKIDVNRDALQKVVG